jgi:hypothetical protein
MGMKKYQASEFAVASGTLVGCSDGVLIDTSTAETIKPDTFKSAFTHYFKGCPGTYWVKPALVKVPELKFLQQYAKVTEAPPAYLSDLFDQGILLAQTHKLEESVQIFIDLDELDYGGGGSPYNVCCMYSQLGQIEPAIAYLKKSIAKGFVNWMHMKGDPDLDNIRKDPRFISAIEELRVSDAFA